MRGINHVTLREGETAVCDCCGAELRKRAVTGVVGCVGEDCWSTIKDMQYYLLNQSKRALSPVELRALPFTKKYLGQVEANRLANSGAKQA